MLHLRWLDLSANQLTALPASIAALTALEHLELRGNPMGALPRILRQLGALREISWARTRCRRDPEESIDDFITRCSRVGAATR